VADKQDAALMIQLAQWGTGLGLQEATRAVFADDFDPDTADASSPDVNTVLAFGETVGTLTKNGLIDTGLILDWLWVSGLWARVGPAAVKERAKRGLAALYENFEALAEQQG
jgi:hypothetical protein